MDGMDGYGIVMTPRRASFSNENEKEKKLKALTRKPIVEK
jgi:hypothetical protein